MSLHAGAATRDISPTRPTQLCGYPHVRRISTGAHDPLLASALFLRNESSAVFMCALDLILLNSDVARQMRRAVAAALGMAESGVLISCTHTHSAPVTFEYLPFRGDIAMPLPDPAYVEFVKDRVVQAALEAKKRARPAELAWTSGDARGVGGNRHMVDGITDPEAGILVVRAAGELVSLALIYGMHPTVLHEDSTLVSSDFPHSVREHLREALGRDLVVLYHTGPAGDQSPRYHVTGQTFAEAERLGRKLGTAVLASLRDLQFTNEIALSALLRAVQLERRLLPAEGEAQQVLAERRRELARLKAQGAERACLRTAEVAVFGAEAQVTLVRAQQSGEVEGLLARLRPFEVQVLRIGGGCVAGLPGELFAAFGLQLKREACARSFVTSYTNGELQGYIVTPEAASAGGYEAASGLFAPSAGSTMVKAALEGISALMQDQPAGRPS